MVRAHIHFSGAVQGVGFRYTTLNLARDLSLTGWVKNLPDGRVETVAEGPREKIEELLSNLKEEFGRSIRDQYIEWKEPKNEFEQFFIAF
jgi:acylphosphatase